MGSAGAMGTSNITLSYNPVAKPRTEKGGEPE